MKTGKESNKGSGGSLSPLNQWLAEKHAKRFDTHLHTITAVMEGLHSAA